MAILLHLAISKSQRKSNLGSVNRFTHHPNPLPLWLVLVSLEHRRITVKLKVAEVMGFI